MTAAALVTSIKITDPNQREIDIPVKKKNTLHKRKALIDAL